MDPPSTKRLKLEASTAAFASMETEPEWAPPQESESTPYLLSLAPDIQLVTDVGCRIMAMVWQASLVDCLELRKVCKFFHLCYETMFVNEDGSVRPVERCCLFSR